MRMEPTQLIQVAISENVLVQAVLTLDNNKVKWFVGFRSRATRRIH